MMVVRKSQCWANTFSMEVTCVDTQEGIHLFHINGENQFEENNVEKH